MGFLLYKIKDEHGQFLESHTEGFGVRATEILETDGYKSLVRFCDANGLKIELKEETILDRSVRLQSNFVHFLICVRGWK